MKANEAPEKIYLQVCGDCPQTDCDNCKFEDLEGNITWCKDKIFDKDVEYTRTDVFIEKACEFMCNNIDKQLTIYHNNTWRTRDEFIEDFKKYMKGE